MSSHEQHREETAAEPDELVVVVPFLTDAMKRTGAPTTQDVASTAGVPDYELGHAPSFQRVYAGRTQRSKRVIELSHLRFLELRRDAERDVHAGKRTPLTDDDLQAFRTEARRQVEGEPISEEDQEAIDEWMCSSTWTEEEGDGQEEVVFRAVLMLGVMSWVYRLLCSATNKAGYAPARRWGAATFLCMAWSRQKPQIEATRNSFAGSNLVNYAFDFPKDDLHKGRHLNRAERRAMAREAGDARKLGLNKQQFGASLHKMLREDHAPELMEHVLVDLFRRFASQTITDRRGRTKPRHIKAGVALVADGSFVQAPVHQCFPRDEQHRAIIVGEGRDAVRYRVYGRDANFYRRNLGYKLVTLCCAATGRCVIGTVVAGDAHEPDVVLQLLKRLFELWPECPAEFLVGDRLFGHSKGFLRQLIFNYGLWPITSWRADYPTDALPKCRCGPDELPMEFGRLKDAFWGPHKRLARVANGRYALARGEQAPTKLRVEYVCPTGTCKSQYGSVWDEPRIHSAYPHHASGLVKAARRRNATRKALLWQRNVVESLYNSIQELGHQGIRGNRPRWARDREVAWLLLAALAYTTARRLVFENGYYERAYEEAVELGLLDDATLDDPSPGPDASALAAARAARAQWGEEERPPGSWLRERGGALPEMRGSAAPRAVGVTTAAQVAGCRPGRPSASALES